LERGQWWFSHEINFTPKAARQNPGISSNMREYLDDNSKPYHFWAHPDNVEGVLNLLAADRALTPQGIYDYKVLGNVHALVSNAVGGGSMIYSYMLNRISITRLLRANLPISSCKNH